MDVLTPEQRRKAMQAIKSTGSSIEVALAKALYARGHRYRKNNKTVFGRPDLTFMKLKIAIFTDGEFWHGKDWETKKKNLTTNQEYWYNKIERNIQRDKEVNEELAKQGWIVLRFWGREVQKNLAECISKIEETINDRKINLSARVSIVNVCGGKFKLRIVEPENYKKFVLPQFASRQRYNSSQPDKKSVAEYTNEISQYKYPEEGITLQAAEVGQDYEKSDDSGIDSDSK